MRTRAVSYVALTVLLAAGCAGTRRPQVHLLSKLRPDPGSKPEACVVDSSGAWLCTFPEFVVRVRHVDDEVLNKAFPEVSYRGSGSANPFTYGNWVDPELGYVPPRFTVFKVDVENRGTGRVRAAVGEAYLRTDRGDSLASLGVTELADRYSVDWPGQEKLVSTARNLAEKSLLSEAWIARGQRGSGYVVFTYLDPAVYRVQLHLPVVVEGDAGSDTVTVRVGFKQKLERVDYPAK